MSRSRVLLVSGLLGAAVGLTLLLPSRDRITEASAAKVRSGMTEGEVEHLLGGPAGNYFTPPRRYGLFGPVWQRDRERIIIGMFPDWDECHTWCGESGFIRVAFDPETGRVSDAEWYSYAHRRPTPGEAMSNFAEDARRWLGF